MAESQGSPAPSSDGRRLPSRPNLEHLKNQAKRMLAELRTRDPKAQLSDAQFAVAQKYGFSNWRALKAHVEALHTPEREQQIERFLDAVERRDIAAVKAMLETDSTLAWCQGKNGARPLMKAANAEHHDAELGMVDLLLQYDPPLSLHEAAAIGRVNVVTSLLKHQHDELNTADDGGMTPLLWAVHGHHADTAAYLLEHGANPNVRESTGWTPLHLAAEWGEPSVIELLLRHGADPDVRLSRGEQPIHVAAGLNHVEVVDVFVKHGQSHDVWTAAGLGRVALLESFIGQVNDALPGGKGMRPVEIAAKAGQSETVDWLLAHGAELDAMSAARLKRFDYIRRRAREDAAWVDRPDAEGTTALHQCAAHRMHEALGVLIECGARLDIKDSSWNATPLGWALHVGDEHAARLLRDAAG